MCGDGHPKLEVSREQVFWQRGPSFDSVVPKCGVHQSLLGGRLTSRKEDTCTSLSRQKNMVQE